MTATLAWHFRDQDGTTSRLAKPEEVGVRYSVKPPIACCRNGLHGSIRAIDALEYAASATAIICRTYHEGEMDHQSNKIASEHRTVLWQADCTAVLHEFACLCAEQSFEVIKKRGAVVAPEMLACVDAKRKWLRGEISDSELYAACDAASDATYAARAAARDARDAACAARDARDAACAACAARAAACAAFRDASDAACAAACAARDAACAAARDAQNTLLEEMLNALQPRGVLTNG